MSRWVKSVRPFWPAFIAAAVGSCVMIGFLLHSSINGNLMSEGRVLLDMPWGVMSLVDLYIGLLLFSCWIWWREPHRSVALLWTLALMVSGNLGTCLYVLIAILRSNGRLEHFIAGPARTKNTQICHSPVESTL
jgi:ABC-type tungstate transport system substrate-binding protein